MVRNIFVITLLAACMAATAAAQTTSGTVRSDETWSGTVTLTGDVYITGGTVTIAPGTEVRFTRRNDNRVNGTYDQIFIIVHGAGGLKAEGTAEHPIVFTSAEANPEPGYYGGIDLEGLTNDANTVFRYCEFRYGHTAIDFRWDNGASGTTETTIEHCLFEKLIGSGIYITSGGIPHVSHCTFRDIDGPGIFSHAAASGDISYCLFYRLNRGIHLVGLSPWRQVIDIDHVTIYDMDPRIGTGSNLGYCISTSDSPDGTVSITNSIFQKTLRACYYIENGWNVSGDYNCFYDYADNFGPDGVEGGDPGRHTLQADPMLVDADNGDFRLLPGSPCIGAADDGTAIGCVQDTATSGVAGREVPVVPGVTVSGNPLVTGTVIAGAGITGAVVFNADGREVARLAGAGTVRWDGTDAAGRSVPAGVYAVRLLGGTAPATALILKK